MIDDKKLFLSCQNSKKHFNLAICFCYKTYQFQVTAIIGYNEDYNNSKVFKNVQFLQKLQHCHAKSLH